MSNSMFRDYIGPRKLYHVIYRQLNSGPDEVIVKLPLHTKTAPISRTVSKRYRYLQSYSIIKYTETCTAVSGCQTFFPKSRPIEKFLIESFLSL